MDEKRRRLSYFRTITSITRGVQAGLKEDRPLCMPEERAGTAYNIYKEETHLALTDIETSRLITHEDF